MAFQIAHSLIQNNVFWGLGINTILAISPISRYLQSAAQPIWIPTPENIAEILGKPLPTITVTDTVRTTLAPITSWSETRTFTMTTTTTTLIRDKTYTSFIPSTTLTETKIRTLLTDHHITHHIPSGTVTSLEYKTLLLLQTECTTSIGTQELRSTETTVSPGLQSSIITKIVFALLIVTFISFGLGMRLQTWRYRHVLRELKNAIYKVRGLEKDMTQMRTSYEHKEANLKDFMNSTSTVQSRLDRLKYIVKTLDGLDIEDFYLDKDNAEYDELLSTLQDFRDTRVEIAVTDEVLGMREAIESLQGRNQQLETHIRTIAAGTDPKDGFERRIFEIGSNLRLAEEKNEQLERRLQKLNGTTTARRSD